MRTDVETERSRSIRVYLRKPAYSAVNVYRPGTMSLNRYVPERSLSVVCTLLVIQQMALHFARFIAHYRVWFSAAGCVQPQS